MLPIERAEVFYPDGSVYRIPEDGTWAEAPPFGTQCVVYYHAPPYTTIDKGGTDGLLFWQSDEFAGTDAKMGLWVDGDTHYRVMDLVSRSITPEVP